MRNVERILMPGVVLACLAAPVTRAQDPCLNCVRDAQNGDAWCDDFEMNSGPNPQCYDTQACTAEPEIPMGCNGWRPWFDDPDVHAVVTCDQNHTEGGIQALAIDTNDDQVRVFEGYDGDASAFWVLTSYIYIPSNMEGDAFWIVNPDYPDPGTTWAIAVRMSIADGICLECTANGACIGLGLITDEWVELRAEINFAADKFRLFYNGDFIAQASWTDPGGGGCGGGSSRIQALDLFSSGATRFYYDDTSLCPAEVPRFTTPDLQCRAIERLDSGCADYWWSLANVNDFDDIVEFYVDVEAGDGGNICGGEEDMTPPPGWTVTLCSGYTNGHALFRLVNDDPDGN
ncbi:MAG: hypothetical protein IID39_00085, partial [Planctomycetes bacterium]|nr:hypothetical protein [Planctomycetota bacterium]